MCGHGSDSQRLRMCGNLEFRKVWTLKEHKGHWYIFQNLQFSEVVSIFSLLYILIPCFSSHPIHTNLAEWGPVTILATTDDSSVRQLTAHWGTPSCALWNTEYAPLCWKLSFIGVLCPFRSSWISKLFIRDFCLEITTGIRSWSIDITLPDNLHYEPGWLRKGTDCRLHVRCSILWRGRDNFLPAYVKWALCWKPTFNESFRTALKLTSRDISHLMRYLDGAHEVDALCGSRLFADGSYFYGTYFDCGEFSPGPNRCSIHEDEIKYRFFL
jgi:hypothetical protein